MISKWLAIIFLPRDQYTDTDKPRPLSNARDSNPIPTLEAVNQKCSQPIAAETRRSHSEKQNGVFTSWNLGSLQRFETRTKTVYSTSTCD